MERNIQINQILQGDSWKLASELSDEYIDCVMTSPPYWGLRDYGVQGQAGLEQHPQEWVDKMVGLCELLRPKLKKSGVMFWNIGETYYGGNSMGGDGNQKESVIPGKIRTICKEEYPEDLNWLQPKQLLGLPWRFAIAMQEKGWILRNSIIWHKPNHMPSSVKDRFANSYEYVFMFVKSRKYYFDLDSIREPYQTYEKRPFGIVSEKDYPNSKFNIRVRDAQKGRLNAKHGNKYSASDDEVKNYDEKTYSTKQQQHPNRTINGFNERWKKKGSWKENNIRAKRDGTSDPDAINPKGKNPGDVWRITTKPHPFAHFAVFPEELAEKCVKAGCPENGVVLDPFMGSGTTCVVAKRLKRNYIGFELNREYIKIAETRLTGINFKVAKDIELGKQKTLKVK